MNSTAIADLARVWSSPAPEVTALERRLRYDCAGDNRYARFLTDHLRTACRRVAANIRMLQTLVDRDDLRILDVGSVGAELLYLRGTRPRLACAAVAAEGQRVGLTEAGFTDRDIAARATLTIERCDAEREPLPFADGAFDVVTCFEQLEHLHGSPLHLMRELRRVLAPTGLLALSTPNGALGRGPERRPPRPNPAADATAAPPGHQGASYAPRELRLLAEGVGFQVLSLASAYHRRVALHERALAVGSHAISVAVGHRPRLHGDHLQLLARRGAGSEDATKLAALFARR